RDEARAALLRRLDARDRRGMGLVARLAPLQRLQPAAPLGRDRRWIGEVLLVEILDEGRVACGERRGGLELLEKAVLVGAHADTVQTKRARPPRAQEAPAMSAAAVRVALEL